MSAPWAAQHPPPPAMGKGGNLEALGLGAAISRPKGHPRGRPNQTAAAHWPPPLGPGVPLEGDKWLALGETRRAATLCKTACGIGTIEPLPLAKGPDGTKGFKIHRTAKKEDPPGAEEGVVGRFLSDVYTYVWKTPISPTTFALLMLSGAALALTVLVLFFRLVLTAIVVTWLAHQVPWWKRLGRYALQLGLWSGGLVLFCLGVDSGIALLGYTVTSLLSLSEPQIRLAILGGALVSFYVIAASEGGGSTRVPYEGTRSFPSSHTPRFAQFLAIHQEAGRLRRKVAATLFFKVFDPGGSSCNISCSCFCLSFCHAEH